VLPSSFDLFLFYIESLILEFELFFLIRIHNLVLMWEGFVRRIRLFGESFSDCECSLEIDEEDCPTQPGVYVCVCICL
jgi:hypothetical protein